MKKKFDNVIEVIWFVAMIGLIVGISVNAIMAAQLSVKIVSIIVAVAASIDIGVIIGFKLYERTDCEEETEITTDKDISESHMENEKLYGEYLNG